MFEVLSLQKKLVSAALPSGCESGVGHVLEELIRPYVDEVYWDTMGNLICHKKGPGKRLVIPAHMDVIGFMATYIDERGFIYYAPVGGHRAYMLPGTRVIFENGVSGIVMAGKDAALMDTPIGKLTQTHYYIDIGAVSKGEAEAQVKIGQLAKFDSAISNVGGGCIMTPYADDLSACIAVLLAAAQMKQSPNDVYFVFTVQEEVGLRGATVAAYRLKPFMCIASDVCYTGDSPESKQMMAVRLGAGPAIKVMDSSLICSPQTVAHLRLCAEAEGIPYQNEILIGGGTDSGAMQLSSGGALSGCVSIPARNVHSPCEIYCEQDVLLAARLLAAAAMRELS